MLEHEIQKLTAAIETMTAVIREQGKPVAEFIPNVPNNVPNNVPDNVPDNVPETLTPGATREGLKEISLQIVRADTSKKKDIVAILEAHGAQTITKLTDAQIHAVHGKFMALAHQIAREAQP
jgi:hypothetical protein